MNKRKSGTAVLVISIIAVICCVLFTFIPHLHKCEDIECLLCDVTKTFKEALMNLGAIAFVSFNLSLVASFLLRYNDASLLEKYTLVGRKVKLSD